MALHFDKYAKEGNEFVNHLSAKLGHPNEVGRTGIILRAVLHTLRDRLTVSESLDLLAQLPMFLKAVYVENWKYLEKPTSIATLDEFTEEVKKHQDQYGEYEFSWEKPTKEIVAIVLNELGKYITEGETRHILAQLPKDLEAFFSENLSK
ncbi:MAG: DUF2267 domain-containing protein [Tangfeifania sp.]